MLFALDNWELLLGMVSLVKFLPSFKPQGHSEELRALTNPATLLNPDLSLSGCLGHGEDSRSAIVK